MRDCEKEVKDGLLGYTRKIRQAVAEGSVDREEEETFVEENAGELLDNIYGSNRIYMKMGMKLGASMVFQLLRS